MPKGRVLKVMQTQRMWTTGKSSLHLSPETVLRHLFSSTVLKEQPSWCNYLSFTRQLWRPLSVLPIEGCFVSRIWSCSVHTVLIHKR